MEDDIRSAVKSGKAVIGYRNSIKTVKSGSEVSSVIIANNIPASMDAEMKHNAKTAGVTIHVFDGSSKDLGTACGKPFPVAAMVIKS